MFKFASIVMLLVVFMSGCSDDDIHSEESQKVQENYHEEKIPAKKIIIEKFAESILEDGILVPGEGSVWGIEKDEFIDNAYGNALIDPNSELFQEFRTTTNKSGISTVEPPLEIEIANIDEEYLSIPNYVFNAENYLYAINYRYLVEVTEKDKLASITKNLISEFNSADNQLSTTDKVEIEKFNFEEDKLIMKWNTADGNQFVRLAGVNFQGIFILDIFISNQP